MSHTKLAKSFYAGHVEVVATRKRALGARREYVKANGTFFALCCGLGDRLTLAARYAEFLMAALFPMLRLAVRPAVPNKHASPTHFNRIRGQVDKAICAFVGT